MKLQYKYAVALTAASGIFMAVLDNTIVNVALTALQKSFKTDVNTVQWVITAYFLAQAAVIPIAGYLGNRFGIKRVFLITLSLFTVGSLLCGLSGFIGGEQNGATLLIIFRIIQGLGGGALFPLATAIAMGAFPPEERAASSAIVAIPVMFAPAFGPTIGGLIIDTLGWEWIFYINIPVSVVALTLVARIVKPDVVDEARAMAQKIRFDYPGLVLSMVGIVLVVYAFSLVGQSEGSSAAGATRTINGWGYWPVWALLIVGILVLVAFAFYELRIVKDPVLDLRLLGNRDYLVSSLLSWIISGVVFGSFFLLPLFLEQFRGYSTLETGLILIPQGVSTAVAIAIGSRLYDKIGPRYLVLMGMAMLFVSSIMLMFVNKDSDWLTFLPILIARGFGFGWSVFPLQTLALSAIVGRALPKASSLFNATRQIFSSIGIAILSTLFTQEIVNQVTRMVGEARAAGRPPAADMTAVAGANAFNNVFLIGTIIIAVATILIVFLPTKSLKQQAQARGEQSGAREVTEHVVTEV